MPNRRLAEPTAVVIIRLPQHHYQRIRARGQVAQLVERSPEKAGVGGSTPSLATIIPKNLAKSDRRFQSAVRPHEKTCPKPVLEPNDSQGLSANHLFLVRFQSALIRRMAENCD